MGNALALLIIVALLVGLVSAAIRIYNRLVFLNNNVDKAFANIDVSLKQRAEEIPNLIAIVKEYMAYEDSMLEKLTKLRTQFLAAPTVDEKVTVCNEITQSLRSIFAVSENYPVLKANDSFISLQNRVSGLEDNIADRREYYNESVTLYNTGIQEFPVLLFAGVLRFSKRHLLQIPDTEKAFGGIKF
ncbi:LemA family protein [Sphingobacterium corticis]|uniref:LemA family protein n=1 Tax=Sphingobacterium corticis TaxID=1812823 RepID=A0ABW5NIM1_9SPHI